jgi:flagellar biosynthesis protein FliP
MSARRIFVALALTALPAAAQGLAPVGIGKGGPAISVPMQIALSLTLLTLLPAAVMCITPFLRITIVLHFLRQALGTQTTPSNQVLLGLALFLAAVIVQPVFSDIYTNAWAPLDKGQITAEQAFERGSLPLKTFLAKFVREKDVRLFVEITRSPAPRNPSDLQLRVLR